MNKVTLIALFLTLTSIAPVHAHSETGSVSLSFDDGYEVVHRYAFPLFKKYGIPGTAYITSGAVGKPGHMTWEQIRELEKEGWEIGAHSVNHLIMEKLPLSEARDEGNQCLQTLREQGFTHVKGFAFPFGSYNQEVISELAKTFSYLRGFWDRDDLNSQDTLNPHLLQVQSIERKVTLDKIQEWLEKAKKEKKDLLLVFHDLEVDGKTPTTRHLGTNRDSLPGEYAYAYEVKDLEKILQLVKESGLKVVTDGQVAELSGEKLLDTSFDSAPPTSTSSHQEDDWKLGSALQISHDSHGSAPSPTNSVQFDGASISNPSEAILQSKKIKAPSGHYIFQGYFNLLSLSEGALVVEVEEFDQNQQLIQKVSLAELNRKKAMTLRRPYQPSSEKVASFQIRIYPKDLKGSAFLDQLTLVRKEL